MGEQTRFRSDAGAVAGFDITNIPLEPTVYFGPDDGLQVELRNINVGFVYELVGRMASPDEGVKSFRRIMRPTADRAVNVWQWHFGEGVLLTLGINCLDPGVYPGSVHAKVSIIQGVGSNIQVLGSLIQDWPSSTYVPTWRVSVARQSVEGFGNIRFIIGSNPATGAEQSETVPTGALWELLAAQCRFVTAAVAGNRWPLFILDNGADSLYEVGHTAFQITTRTYDYFLSQAGFASGAFSYSGNNQKIQLPLPPGLFLRPGFRLRTVTTGLNAADEYDTFYLTVREWLL